MSTSNTNGFKNYFLRLPTEDQTIDRIETYKEKTEIKTDVEAIRQLLKKGYEQFEKEQTILENINN
jgi:hypothetical protein